MRLDSFGMPTKEQITEKLTAVIDPELRRSIVELGMVRSIERIEQRGRVLIWALSAYGAATIVFGLSTSSWLTNTHRTSSGSNSSCQSKR